MCHGHQERPAPSKLEAKLRFDAVFDGGSACGQLSQIRHRT
jgi:hypothetical protein